MKDDSEVQKPFLDRVIYSCQKYSSWEKLWIKWGATINSVLKYQYGFFKFPLRYRGADQKHIFKAHILATLWQMFGSHKTSICLTFKIKQVERLEQNQCVPVCRITKVIILGLDLATKQCSSFGNSSQGCL